MKHKVMFSSKKLKQLRKKNGYSLDKLALLCNSSKSYIWELENSKNISLSRDKVYLLSQALGVRMDYFYGESVDNTKEVLGTLISQLNRELGWNNCKYLLEKLNET